MHPAGYLLSAIEGAERAWQTAPADCDLSEGIEIDEEAVTFHLVDAGSRTSRSSSPCRSPSRSRRTPRPRIRGSSRFPRPARTWSPRPGAKASSLNGTRRSRSGPPRRSPTGSSTRSHGGSTRSPGEAFSPTPGGRPGRDDRRAGTAGPGRPAVDPPGSGPHLAGTIHAVRRVRHREAAVRRRARAPGRQLRARPRAYRRPPRRLRRTSARPARSCRRTTRATSPSAPSPSNPTTSSGRPRTPTGRRP